METAPLLVSPGVIAEENQDDRRKGEHLVEKPNDEHPFSTDPELLKRPIKVEVTEDFFTREIRLNNYCDQYSEECINSNELDETEGNIVDTGDLSVVKNEETESSSPSMVGQAEISDFQKSEALEENYTDYGGAAVDCTYGITWVKQEIDCGEIQNRTEIDKNWRITYNEGCDYRAKLKRTRKPAAEKRYECYYCGYKSDYIHNLKIHIFGVHTGEKTQACHLCEYRSVTKAHLKAHHMRVHSNEKPSASAKEVKKLFECLKCSYRTIHMSSMLAHSRGHTGEKPFQCSECNYSSAHRSSIIKHRRLHTGEKPFICTYCPYRSADSSTVTRHKRSVHLKDKPFKCPHCPMSSFKSSDVRSHIVYRHPTA